MNKYIILLISFTLAAGCKEVKTSEPYNYTVISIDSLEQIGIDQYSRAPELAIRAYEEISSRSRKISNHEKSGAANFNISKIYAEQLNDYSNAITYSNEAIKDWESKDDANQIASISKYLSYLQSLNGNHLAAEESINKAINIYEKLGDLKGVAMAKLSLADLKTQQGDYDAALKSYKSSKSFWLKEGDQGKIFENNLLGIEIYQELGEDKLASKLLKDNIAIARTNEIPKKLMDLFEPLVEVVDK